MTSPYAPRAGDTRGTGGGRTGPRLPVAGALLRASHPEPAAAVTVVAGLLAVAVGHSAGGVALVTAVVAASQLATGWSNDAVDAGRDAAVSRADKPLVTGGLTRRTVATAAVATGLAAVLLALPFGAAAAAAAALGLASALAYNWPLKRTPLSPLPYAVSFAALPAFVVLALPAVPPGWMIAAGALLGTGAHFANVLPDLDDDAATGVRGLPHRLGRGASEAAAAALLLGTVVVLVTGPARLPAGSGPAALAGAGVVLAAGWYADRTAAARRRGRPVRLFRAFLLVALVNVALLLAGGYAGGGALGYAP